MRQLLADRVAVAEQAVHVGRHDVVEVAQAVHVDVEDGDVGVEAGGDLGRVRADDAAAEDRDVRRRHARHAAQQDAAAHLRPLQKLGALLNAHPAGHFAHRREQRQAALVVGQRFVGDARRAAGEHRFGQLAIGGEVEIGEEHLALADQLQFAGLRLLDFHDQVGPGEDLLGPADQLGARPQIIVIRQAGAEAGARFDQHLVPAADELLDARPAASPRGTRPA